MFEFEFEFWNEQWRKYLSKEVKVITLVCFWISGKSPRDCRELHKMKNRRTGNEVRNSTGFAEFGLVCIFAKKQFPSWSLTKKKYICVWALLVRWKRCCRWHYAHQYTGHLQECVPAKYEFSFFVAPRRKVFLSSFPWEAQKNLELR